MKKDRFPCDDVHRPKKTWQDKILDITKNNPIPKIFKPIKNDNKRTDASK